MTTISITQSVFARLVREHERLTDIDRQIMRAFERLMDGRPAITDGSVTAVNIAAEGGVSRASYYRSPVAAAIKEILSAPRSSVPRSTSSRPRSPDCASRNAHSAGSTPPRSRS